MRKVKAQEIDNLDSLNKLYENVCGTRDPP